VSVHLDAAPGLRAKTCLQNGGIDDNDDAQTMDESVEAFTKLKRYQPRLQQLQNRREEQGTLDAKEEEEYEFLADEVQSLVEIMQQCGFNMPGYACCHCTIQNMPNLSDRTHSCVTLLTVVTSL
jgi:hypothetical protein